jgi:hypothetical protein
MFYLPTAKRRLKMVEAQGRRASEAYIVHAAGRLEERNEEIGHFQSPR